MLWLKAFHIVFVVTWFAGLFYLPRLFVYHAEAADTPSRERFVVMERRLLAITNLGAVLALGFGVAMLVAAPAYLALGWMHAKLALVLVLIGFHGANSVLARSLRLGTSTRSARWFRIYNEAPALLLVAIVLLVVLKPF
jgi:protoporphyrinogen IX oxidase